MDDTFQAILSVNRPVPIAIKYLFDFLDKQAEKHGIDDPETLHIWKTNRCLACCPCPQHHSGKPLDARLATCPPPVQIHRDI